jgi:hypothetical protein
MARGWIHTVHPDGQWHNEVEGSERASSFVTPGSRPSRGRELAINAKTEDVIQNLDGTTGQRNSYGNDPTRPPASRPAPDSP